MTLIKKCCFAAIVMVLTLSFTTDSALDYPAPVKKNMLFYVQRSINKNTIVYEVNLDQNNEVNIRQPFRVYWINYSGKGDEEGLSYLQAKYAYGLEHKVLDVSKKTVSFNFVSYKKQTLFLICNEQSRHYEVFSYFNKVLMKVNRIYVHIEGGSFWFPSVKYVQVSGTNHTTGDEWTERIIP
jgi:hypothetical protein